MILLLTLLACHPALDATRPTALWRDDDGMFGRPFPSDGRLTEAGGLDWSALPNPAGIAVVDQIKALSAERPGASLAAPVYLRLSGTPELTLPLDPTTSASATSPLQIVDVDPRSPTYGERVPLVAEFRAEPGAWYDDHLLAFAPLPGTPLRPRTTYAALVTTAIAAPDDGFLDAWQTDPTLQPLRDALPDLDLRADALASATVFTTLDPTVELDTIARFLDERVSVPAFGPVSYLTAIGAYEEYRTQTSVPIFMSGTKPYADAGGRFVFRDDGLPEVQAWEPLRVALIPPTDRTAPPPKGWPLLISLHGTGGDWLNVAGTNSPYEIAQWAAELGVVTVSWDLPLHGARSTPDTIIDLHSFNILQPESALHMHRQAASELLYLLEAFERGPSFTLPSGEVLAIDPARIAFIGHSQGGLTGAIAAPWFGGRVQGAMLSGTGGMLAITAVERDSDYDFPAIIKGLLQFDEGEALTELHPVLGAVQALVDPTDPVHYGRLWFAEDDGLHKAAPTSVLMTSGLRDDMTPFRTAEALAANAGLPFVGTRYSAADAARWRGLGVEAYPARDNVVGWDGAPRTAGLSQHDSGTHFVIFQQELARDLARNYIGAALFDASPSIDPLWTPAP
jgi:predicted esterase